VKKLIAALALAAVTCTGCSWNGSAADKVRDTQVAKKATGDTLEKKNLEEKRRREEKPNAIGYVYLFNLGSDRPIGYYVTKGKVSSNGSQMTPDQDVQWTCRGGHGCVPGVVNAAEDDGSYGPAEDGIFFFLADGTKVTTDLVYLWSDNPLPIDVPNLGK
jgi:hypothetical protein